MNIETLVPQVLNPIVGGRVWHNATPGAPPRDAQGNFQPFIIWTLHGGQDQEYIGQVMPEFVNCRIQLAAFAPSAIVAGELLRSARDRLLASDYTVGVYGSPLGTYDAARDLEGRVHQFGIWFRE